jgi:predicted AlkP superfamily pyrophosphatase or phosphodiesterase
MSNSYKFLLVFLLVTDFYFSQIAKSPKLVVGIVVDQMCYDYLYRFQPRFGKDGFLKLMQKGVNCRNTHFNYIPTYTAPGHASIYTGTTPSNHKIIANDWFSRKRNKVVYCVEDSNSKSPFNLKALTITDQLKLTYPNANVYSLSLKDRSAILPGGHLSDGSFWYDDKIGELVTNSSSKPKINWLVDFNNQNYVKKAIEEGWKPLFKTSTYASWYKDSSDYEQSVFKSNAFPYNFKGDFFEKEQNKLFTYLPAANSMLTDFSIELIKKQGLGNDETPDFLSLSYSSTDILGHAYGPYSHEVEDMYLRLDKDLARLISYLEKNIGKDNFVLFLTADHAVLPVPQMLIDMKLPGGYFYINKVESKLKEDVLSYFKCDFIQKIINNNIYLNRELIEKNGIDYHVALQFIKQKVEEWKHVFSVYTSDEIKNGLVEDNFWSKMITNGFDKDLSGDLIYILNPGFLSKKSEDESDKKGTSHGSPFGYDTQVPLLFYGKNIKAREVYKRIEITDIVPTLVPMLNIAQPATTTGQPILDLLEN